MTFLNFPAPYAVRSGLSDRCAHWMDIPPHKHVVMIGLWLGQPKEMKHFPVRLWDKKGGARWDPLNQKFPKINNVTGVSKETIEH